MKDKGLNNRDKNVVRNSHWGHQDLESALHNLALLNDLNTSDVEMM